MLAVVLVVFVAGEEGMVAVDAGVVAVSGDVGQEELVLLRTEQLLVGLQADLLQLRQLLLSYQAVYPLLLQAAPPHFSIAFLGRPVSPDVDLLNLDVQAALLEHHLALLPLPHPALEEIADRLEHRHLKVVIAHHLGDETRQLAVPSCLYDLPLA